MKKLLKITRSPYPLFKNDLKMKLSTLFILATLFSMKANDSYGQHTKVTLNMNDVTIGQVIDEIEDSTEFEFVYIIDDVDLKRKVSVSANKEKIARILKRIFKNTVITFNINDRRVYLIKGVEPVIGDKEKKVLSQPNQQSSISGTVIDENGQPLPGANILEKGTTNGTQTDFDGDFSIAVVDSNAILVISYIGFTTKKVIVGDQTQINIQMLPDAAGLDEVVVIGYGTAKKSDLTGSVSSIKEKDFNQGANASVDQLIQGRAAGVNISQTGGEPGGGLSVRIRGASSVNASSDPLYVVDGFPIDNSPAPLGGNNNFAEIGTNQNPRNPLNALNPNDIKSIEILKDASSTAIYGSRGANGVILITTKKGKDGQVKVNYNTQLGFQSVINRFDLLSTSQYIEEINALAIDSGLGIQIMPEEVANIGAGTDWQNEVFRSAVLQTHDVSVSGGNEKTTYFVSGNYYNQDGVVINSGIEKFIGRLNLETKLGEKIKLGANINTSLIKDNNNTDGLNINAQAGPINAALLYAPTESIFDSDGTFSQSPLLTVNNPRAVSDGISSETVTNRTLGNLYFDWGITDNLNAKVNFGSDRENVRRDIFNSSKTLRGSAAGGIADINEIERSNLLLEYTMNYNKEINENNSFNILGGVTYQDFTIRSVSANVSGFPSDVLSTNNLLLGNNATSRLASNKEGNTLLSYLGRANYNLYNKYLVTGSFRVDGSSRFGENSKYGVFPSFAFAWKLVEEEFIPEVFSDLKLRASWGETGNQEIGNFNSLLTFGTGANAVFNNQINTSANPTRIPNPDLKWETTEQINIGLDFGLFKNRISGSLDYFVKTTSDQLFAVPLPTASGYSSFLTNLGELQNKGFELFLSTNNISTPDFSWDTTFNFATLKNEVTDLDGFGPILTGNVQDVGNTSIVREGDPLGSYLGFQVDGIFQEGTDFSQTAQPNGRPGDPIFRDVNEDGVIDPKDRLILGKPFPDYTFGLSNSLRYKNLQLDFFIQGQQGVELININQIESLYPNNFRRNRIAEHLLDRWTPQNPDAKYPSSVNPFAYGGSKVNSLVVEDASFIRLKNVQLAYNIPVGKIKFLQSLRLSLVGQNLITITDYKGFDPEANSFGRGNARIDYSSYPSARSIIIGVNIGL